MHLGGKIRIQNKIPLTTRDALSMAYTPGVARVCEAIAADKSKVNTLTIKHNSVAVVSDGSAVLGLGNIGPEAAMPVMEGKAMLFKEFADIDAYPICLQTQDPDEIVQAVRWISTGFGGINLEDISAPRCFDIEQRLKRELDIPVFHDDQHGTAIVVLAATLNALKIVKKKLAGHPDRRSPVRARRAWRAPRSSWRPARGRSSSATVTARSAGSGCRCSTRARPGSPSTPIRATSTAASATRCAGPTSSSA